eukprot:TRINITY_DN6697_c0_g1_i1.p1 TRINITY_DN6697_c0_g1~~TRINITY_DN6697_c0_g1_i1.p1  ORF type:complete len:249 (+),score=75.40 TRINITY_DN6697_c0_g1_i1:106-852(+)
MNKENDKVIKEIYFVRHGQSITNIAKKESGKNIVCFDAPLSDIGKRQAKECAKKLMELEKEFDLIISSPLTRAIETCKIYLNKSKQKDKKINITIQSTERLTTYDDVGSSLYIQSKKFTNLEIIETEDQKNDEVWYYVPKNLNLGTTKEVYESFLNEMWREDVSNLKKRVEKFKQFLLKRKEKKIVVFGHGDFMTCIIGYQPRNCEIIKTVVSESDEDNYKGFPFKVVFSSDFNVEYFSSFWEDDLSE